MKYKASWKNTHGFTFIILLMIIMLIISSFLFEAIFLLFIGLIFLLFFLILPFRIYAILLEDKLIYQGWFKKSEVFIKDVISLTCASDFKYPRNRYYGPRTYEICTPNDCFLINLLFFHSEFNNKFHEIFKNKRKYK